MVAAAFAGLTLSCAAVGIGAANDAPVAKPMRPRLEAATVWTPMSAAPDTLVLQVRWNLPGDDGRGAVDSVAVNVSNLTAHGWLRVTVPVLSVAVVVRQPLPYGSATYTVRAQVCAYRRKQVACADTAAEYAYTEPPLRPVTGLSVSATTVP